MKPGIISKKETNGILLLERKMLGIHQILRLTRELCIDCGICAASCPQEAVKLGQPSIKNGRLARRMLADLDAGKCTFCGICAVLCPANAVEIETNGKQALRVVDSGAFPTLLKKIEINVGKCNIECNLKCQDACPRGAIEVVLTAARESVVCKIEGVNIDGKLCVFCKKCEFACPENAINVTGPFSGLIKLHSNSCLKACQVCVDACPTKAISLTSRGKPMVDERLCIYCGACKEACPENTISVTRTMIRHTDVSSGTWISTLEKLTSRPQLVKELTSRAHKKLHEVAQGMGQY